MMRASRYLLLPKYFSPPSRYFRFITSGFRLQEKMAKEHNSTAISREDDLVRSISASIKQSPGALLALPEDRSGGTAASVAPKTAAPKRKVQPCRSHIWTATLWAACNSFQRWRRSMEASERNSCCAVLRKYGANDEKQ